MFNLNLDGSFAAQPHRARPLTPREANRQTALTRHAEKMVALLGDCRPVVSIDVDDRYHALIDSVLFSHV